MSDGVIDTGEVVHVVVVSPNGLWANPSVGVLYAPKMHAYIHTCMHTYIHAYNTQFMQTK